MRSIYDLLIVDIADWTGLIIERKILSVRVSILSEKESEISEIFFVGFRYFRSWSR